MRPLALTLLAVMAGCGRPADPPAVSTTKPELALEGVTLRVYRDSQPKLFARAAKVALMRSTGAIEAEQLHLDFLSNGLALDAARLHGNLSTLAFDLEQGVTLESTGADPRTTLWGTSPTAHFEGKEGAHGVASGKDAVQLRGLSEGRSYELTAARFRFDIAQQHATFEPARSKVGAR